MEENGGGLTKLIISIIALLVVLGIAYRLLKDDRVFNILFPENVFGSEARQIMQQVRDGVTHVIDPVVAPIVDRGQTLIQKVIDTVTGTVDEGVEQVKQRSLNSAKSIIHKNLAVIEETLGTIPVAEQGVASGNENWLGGTSPRASTLTVQNPLSYPPVISVNTHQVIEAIQAAQVGEASKEVIAKLGLPAALQATQGNNGILVMKDDVASTHSGKPVFVVLWEKAQTTFEEIGRAIAATFQNIFGYNAEYRMSIPVTKDGVTKNYRVYIIVE